MILALLLCPTAQVQPAPAPALPEIKAQYAWGYVGSDGEGKGTLIVWVEPSTGKVVLELHGAGERLVLLEGDRASGYRLQIPRRELDQRAPSFAGLDIPFVPMLGTVEALHALLTRGSGPGVTVGKTDKDGPVKLRYRGKDERGKTVRVWLDRERWEIVRKADAALTPGTTQ